MERLQKRQMKKSGKNEIQIWVKLLETGVINPPATTSRMSKNRCRVTARSSCERQSSCIMVIAKLEDFVRGRRIRKILIKMSYVTSTVNCSLFVRFFSADLKLFY